jgi:DNA-binding NarL/FixJ family response regulator
MAAKILIVDDSPVLRKILRICLGRDARWEVCGEAENGQVAVDKVRELSPDIVILDFAMPVMNGLDAARQIAVIAPETITLLFTMQETGRLTTAAQGAGIREVLSKSVGLIGLQTRLATLVEQSRSQDAY